MFHILPLDINQYKCIVRRLFKGKMSNDKCYLKHSSNYSFESKLWAPTLGGLQRFI